MNHRGLFGIAVLAVLMFFAVPDARADERILDFHSEISIASDATLDVTETIKVRSEFNRIQHGIFRDFPTSYQDRLGNNVVVRFQLLDAHRDGHEEASKVEEKSNGVRVYLGTELVRLPAGEHTYVLHYQASRELGFFDDHDELYWNATGNGWDFPIDQASVHVQLPSPVPVDNLKAQAFTGPQGARGMDWQANIDGPGSATFSATAVLPPRNGMTIVLMFPKGIVAAPSQFQRLRWLLSDNAAVLVGLIGLIGLWAYFVWAWRVAGRDPEPGVIIAQYDPPPGATPAELRYVQRMAYDNRCFTSDLVAMAVGGFLTILQDDDTWTLSRPTTAIDAPTDPSQCALGLGLLPTPGDALILKDVNADTIGAARKAHEASLQSSFEDKYFVTNSSALMPAIVWTVAIGIIVLGIGAHGGMAFGLVLLALMVATIVLFARLMKAQTDEGRKLLDIADGLKLYMSVADRDELHALKLPNGSERPALDADRYQKLLPFALALGVEEAWTHKFTAAVGAIAAQQAASSVGWYAGNAGMPINFSGLGRSLGTGLDGAISSSSTPPGSSSGGGGFSGGGGGGGGGGGW